MALKKTTDVRFGLRRPRSDPFIWALKVVIGIRSIEFSSAQFSSALCGYDFSHSDRVQADDGDDKTGEQTSERPRLYLSQLLRAFECPKRMAHNHNPKNDDDDD